MELKNVARLGIIVCFAYFIATLSLVVTGLRGWLFAMEIVTILSGMFMVPLFLWMPASPEGGNHKTLSIVFAAAAMILTSLAHTLNLTVTMPLLARGVPVPEYVQIGKWPSIEMAADYLAWGLFIGCAFIFSSLAIKPAHPDRLLKNMLLACGILCFAGFFGATLMNVDLWYVAPLGYGIGTAAICIKLSGMSRSNGQRA